MFDKIKNINNLKAKVIILGILIYIIFTIATQKTFPDSYTTEEINSTVGLAYYNELSRGSWGKYILNNLELIDLDMDKVPELVVCYQENDTSPPKIAFFEYDKKIGEARHGPDTTRYTDSNGVNREKKVKHNRRDITIDAGTDGKDSVINVATYKDDKYHIFISSEYVSNRGSMSKKLFGTGDGKAKVISTIDVYTFDEYGNVSVENVQEVVVSPTDSTAKDKLDAANKKINEYLSKDTINWKITYNSLHNLPIQSENTKTLEDFMKYFDK